MTAPQRIRRVRQPARPDVQRGISMLVVMALLLAIGLMALTGFHLSRGQFQLVGNIQHQELAFTQAEAASAVAEKWLNTGSNARSPAFTTYDAAQKGLYPAGKLAALGLDPATMTWGDGNSIASGGSRYLIEQIAKGVKLPGSGLQTGQRKSSSCHAVDLFRVVARSSSVRGSSRMVETFYVTDGC